MISEGTIRVEMDSILRRWPKALSTYRQWASEGLVRPLKYTSPCTDLWIVPVAHIDSFDRGPELFEGHLPQLRELPLDDRAAAARALLFWKTFGH